MGGQEEEGEFTKKSQEFRRNGSLSEAGEKGSWQKLPRRMTENFHLQCSSNIPSSLGEREEEAISSSLSGGKLAPQPHLYLLLRI